MFELFSENFQPDGKGALELGAVQDIGNMPEITELFRLYGGMSFQDGLYRVIRPRDLSEWNLRIAAAFPKFKENVVCFGYDWLGTVFAADSRKIVDGRPGIIMFEPGTGKALNVPANVKNFHDIGLKIFGEAALASSFHQKWLSSGGSIPTYDQCVGYKKPLLLGGKDNISNLEISDVDVYWHLMSQIIKKVQGLPIGTRIKTTIS
jgi:hypothetical protein